MPFILVFFVVLLMLVIVWRAFNHLPIVPRTHGDWGVTGNDDPRLAVAAMLYSVAVEDGALTGEEERHIIGLLVDRLRLEPHVARTCMMGGKRLSKRVTGNLNSRLHQLNVPVTRHCNGKERRDVVEMLRDIAGESAESAPAVRDALGRISATLLNG